MKEDKHKLLTKGFTLIELLAVILILGIITLIAIPTVNNVLDSSRLGAFTTGNDHIIKAVTENCQLEILKDHEITKKYIIEDEKISPSINVKGKLANEGVIRVSDKCEVKYTLCDKKLKETKPYSDKEGEVTEINKENMCTYSTEDEHYLKNFKFTRNENSDYISDEAFRNEAYKDKIHSVSFINDDTIPSGAINWDLSQENDGSIKGWLVADGNKYDLIIGSKGKIMSPPNSTKLFYDLPGLTEMTFDNFDTYDTIIMESMFGKNYGFNDFFAPPSSTIFHLDLSSFDTSNVKSMDSIFIGSKATSIDLTSFDTSKVTNMNAMFYGSSVKTLNLSSFDTSNVTDMSFMFYATKIPSIDLSNFKTSKVTDMNAMFGWSSFNSLNLSNFNTSKVTNMNAMFGNCLATTLDLSSFDTSNVTNMASMFSFGEMNTIYIGPDWVTSTNNVEMFYKCKTSTLTQKNN